MTPEHNRAGPEDPSSCVPLATHRRQPQRRIKFSPGRENRGESCAPSCQIKLVPPNSVAAALGRPRQKPGEWAENMAYLRGKRSDGRLHQLRAFAGREAGQRGSVKKLEIKGTRLRPLAREIGRRVQPGLRLCAYWLLLVALGAAGLGTTNLTGKRAEQNVGCGTLRNRNPSCLLPKRICFPIFKFGATRFMVQAAYCLTIRLISRFKTLVIRSQSVSRHG